MLDWSQVIPEGFNASKNEALYVYNHDLSSPEKIDRTIRFIIGRLNYYDNHLPENATHNITVDIRGQQLRNGVCEFMIEEIKAWHQKPDTLTITFVQ